LSKILNKKISSHFSRFKCVNKNEYFYLYKIVNLLYEEFVDTSFSDAELIENWNFNFTCDKCYIRCNSSRFVGGQNKFNNVSLQRVFNNLPMHNFLLIQLNLIFIGDWNGEKF